MFSALLMAVLDGVQNKINPGKPLDRDIYHMSKDELSKFDHTPGSLAEALDALKKDNKFLLQGGVFTQDVIDAWIEYKMENEIDPLRLRPHPHEFFLYYDN